MWNTVKQITGNNKNKPPRMIVHKNEKVTSLKRIANIANNFYITKIQNLSKKFRIFDFSPIEILKKLITSNRNKWELKPITLEETKKLSLEKCQSRQFLLNGLKVY